MAAVAATLLRLVPFHLVPVLLRVARPSTAIGSVPFLVTLLVGAVPGLVSPFLAFVALDFSLLTYWHTLDFFLCLRRILVQPRPVFDISRREVLDLDHLTFLEQVSVDSFTFLALVMSTIGLNVFRTRFLEVAPFLAA